MKRFLAGILLLGILIGMPVHGLSEDKDIVKLAQCIYAVAREESYEAKLALGSVVMNRIEDPWYPDTLHDVLVQKHQFPAGRKYDDESLKAAHAVVTGTRTIGAEMVEWSTEAVEGAQQIGGISVFIRK